MAKESPISLTFGENGLGSLFYGFVIPTSTTDACPKASPEHRQIFTSEATNEATKSEAAKRSHRNHLKPFRAKKGDL